MDNELETRLAELRLQSDESQQRINALWNELFVEKTKRHRPVSFASRAVRLAADAPEIIDGALLGWKLYRRFLRGRK